uniref:Plastid lipid-associated protein/fibrillin conserved domain-containing protein n=1 Tax=Lotharella globosa TaxID=91324 RepID=A0A7S3Z7R5_9EUKA
MTALVKKQMESTGVALLLIALVPNAHSAVQSRGAACTSRGATQTPIRPSSAAFNSLGDFYTTTRQRMPEYTRQFQRWRKSTQEKELSSDFLKKEMKKAFDAFAAASNAMLNPSTGTSTPSVEDGLTTGEFKKTVKMGIGKTEEAPLRIEKKEEIVSVDALAFKKAKRAVMRELFVLDQQVTGSNKKTESRIIESAMDLVRAANQNQGEEIIKQHRVPTGRWKLSFTSGKDAQSFKSMGALSAVWDITEEETRLEIDGKNPLRASGPGFTTSGGFDFRSVLASAGPFNLMIPVPLPASPFDTRGKMTSLYSDDEMCIVRINHGASTDLAILTRETAADEVVASADSGPWERQKLALMQGAREAVEASFMQFDAALPFGASKAKKISKGAPSTASLPQADAPQADAPARPMMRAETIPLPQNPPAAASKPKIDLPSFEVTDEMKAAAQEAAVKVGAEFLRSAGSLAKWMGHAILDSVLETQKSVKAKSDSLTQMATNNGASQQDAARNAEPTAALLSAAAAVKLPSPFAPETSQRRPQRYAAAKVVAASSGPYPSEVKATITSSSPEVRGDLGRLMTDMQGEKERVKGTRTKLKATLERVREERRRIRAKLEQLDAVREQEA